VRRLASEDWLRGRVPGQYPCQVMDRQPSLLCSHHLLNIQPASCVPPTVRVVTGLVASMGEGSTPATGLPSYDPERRAAPHRNG
jgi:hypothetical protein